MDSHKGNVTFDELALESSTATLIDTPENMTNCSSLVRYTARQDWLSSRNSSAWFFSVTFFWAEFDAWLEFTRSSLIHFPFNPLLFLLSAVSLLLEFKVVKMLSTERFTKITKMILAFTKFLSNYRDKGLKFSYDVYFDILLRIWDYFLLTLFACMIVLLLDPYTFCTAHQDLSPWNFLCISFLVALFDSIDALLNFLGPNRIYPTKTDWLLKQKLQYVVINQDNIITAGNDNYK